MKKRLILYILIVLIFIISIIGLTYAFMKPKVEEKDESTNISINACAKIQLKDNGNAIALENTYPMDNDMGLETKPYEFTINSTCDDYVGFNLYLTSLKTNEIEDNNIHFAITNKNKEVLNEGILGSETKGDADFNSEEIKELDLGIKGEHKNIYKVYSNNIPLQGESDYQLYLWVDKDASNETMGQTFQVSLSVKSFNREETMAEYLIKNKDNSLIYHDGSYKDEEGNIIDAFDYSYRYAGASEEVKNFVCLDGGVTIEGKCANDDDLYRIIGLFKNAVGLYEMKIIKYDYATIDQLGDKGARGSRTFDEKDFSYYKGNLQTIPGYYWNSATNGTGLNKWAESDLNKINLNQNFYNYLTSKNPKLVNIIITHKWIIGGSEPTNLIKTSPEVYNYEVGKNKTTTDTLNCWNNGRCSQKELEYQDYIGLLYVSDYGYAAYLEAWPTYLLTQYNNSLITQNNWLYMGINEWTISRTNNFFNVHIIYNTGNVYHDRCYYTSDLISEYGNAVRPVFYLNANTNININNSNGTKENPYRLS